jgi:outer membrane biosynthesis protein TonB
MRPRPDEYLIETKVGTRSRKLVWHDDEPLDLDMPQGWVVEKIDGLIRFRDKSDPDADDHIVTDEFAEGKPKVVQLPSAKVSHGLRPLAVEVVKLAVLRPVYVNSTTPTALHTTAPRQLCQFYGQRYFLIRYRPVSTDFEVSLGTVNIFRYQKTPTGMLVAGFQQGLKINIGGKKILLPPGHSIPLSNVDFFRCTFVLGVHWWRFRMVPTPDQQPPLETDENEIDLREAKRLTTSTIAVMSTLTIFLFAAFILGKMYPEAKKVTTTQVTIKQPKYIPPIAEVKKPEPTPPPTPPPQVVEVKPEPPKPEPPKKVVKREPVKAKKQPQKKIVVAKKEPVKQPAPKAAPAPPVKVVKQGPSPDQLKAIAKAKEQQAEQAQLAKSLGFLSSSKSKPTVDPTSYEKKEGKFANNAAVGGVTSKSNVLDKIANGAPGDGDIKTKSSRGIATDDIKFANNKGLNDVQGKVSSGELYSKNGNPTGHFMSGNSKGLELSGPGELSESEIDKALAKFANRFQYCYEKALLSDSGLGGNLVVQWTIGTSGKASASRVVKSQLNNNDLHSCVLKVLGEVPFPHPKGGEVIVKKTFTFSSSSI